MGLKLSSLTLTERTLQSLHAPSALAIRAREIAHSYINDRGGHRGTDQALSFLRLEAKLEYSTESSYLILRDAQEPLPLPKHYGLKGGAARERLLSAAGIHSARQPRDLDLIRRGQFHNKEDDQAAQRFMIRDYFLGARVELIRDLGRYMASRDITINEVASFSSTLSVSILGMLDSIGHVLRPSYYRSGTLHKGPSLDGKILLKMVRLFAEGEYANESWLLVGMPDHVSFSEFDLAIHLNKAFQRGSNVAERFDHTCALLSLIPASDDLLRTTLTELGHFRYGERGLFPDVPSELWK